jgi:hypothetical protein
METFKVAVYRFLFLENARAWVWGYSKDNLRFKLINPMPLGVSSAFLSKLFSILKGTISDIMCK